MSLEFEKDNFISIKRLSANVDYYNHVFKRCERIASVVFYILSYIDRDEKTDLHHTNLSDKSMRLHEAALASLNLHEYEAKDGLVDLMQSLVAMESTLRLAAAARIIRSDVHEVVITEIDALQRYVRNHYFKEEGMEFEALREPEPAPRKTPSRKTQRPSIPPGDMSSEAPQVYENAPDRATRIKTVLAAKPEATIKDIASVVTDCSEKTIQRELNSLIDSGEVIRQGERRWSRYLLA